jgi:DNA-binding protein HU-beta
MHKAELIEAIAQSAGVAKKDSEAVIAALENLVIERLKQGQELTLTGFGTFSARTRNARMGVNPQKPSEKIEIPTVIVPKFKAGKTLKDALKK